MSDERWIEAEWLESLDGTKKSDEDGVDRDITDLFADPDPFDTFSFEWPRRPATTSSDHGQKTSIPNEDSETIKIALIGYKAELGQTLQSTGLTLWRASPMLCDFLVENEDRFIRGKKVVELGSGLGLCGILAARLGADNVLLTDGDTDALEGTRRNVEANFSASASISCKQLVWGRNLSHFVGENGLFDTILGSDIIYVEEIITPLWFTVDRLLKADGRFLLAYARRNVSIDIVLDKARDSGFIWENPTGSPESVFVFRRR